MRTLRMLIYGLVGLALLGLGGAAWAAGPQWVQGNYVGQALLAKQGDGSQGKGQITTVKAEIKQSGDQITGSLIVGDKPDDLIVLAIIKGEVQDDFLWFQGEEMIWRCQFSGHFKNNEINGTILFLNHNPAEKLLPEQVKSFQPVKLSGPLDLTRR